MRTALLLALALAVASPSAALAQLDPEGAPPPQPPSTVAAPRAPDPAPVPQAAGPAAPQSGPYVGFSFGTGRGDVFAGGTTTAVSDLVPGASPTTLALMLRAGWASGALLFGVQANIVRSQWDAGGVSSAMQLTGVDVVATWRPPDLGLYARVGAGPAQLSFEGGGASESYGGAEAFFGIGFMTGGLGVGIDYIRQSYDEGAPIDGAGYLLATLSLDLG
jgi:hypothetical protein